MTTKKYKVIETKGDKFQEAAINSVWCCLEQIGRKNSARAIRPLCLPRPVRKLKPHAGWKRICKISSTQQWFNLSPRGVWFITTLDDNQLDDFISTPKADLFGKCLWGPTERIIKRKIIVINKRKRGHTFSNYRIPKLLAVANRF